MFCSRHTPPHRVISGVRALARGCCKLIQNAPDPPECRTQRREHVFALEVGKIICEKELNLRDDPQIVSSLRVGVDATNECFCLGHSTIVEPLDRKGLAKLKDRAAARLDSDSSKDKAPMVQHARREHGD